MGIITNSETYTPMQLLEMRCLEHVRNFMDAAHEKIVEELVEIKRLEELMLNFLNEKSNHY